MYVYFRLSQDRSTFLQQQHITTIIMITAKAIKPIVKPIISPC